MAHPARPQGQCQAFERCFQLSRIRARTPISPYAGVKFSLILSLEGDCPVIEEHQRRRPPFKTGSTYFRPHLRLAAPSFKNGDPRTRPPIWTVKKLTCSNSP